MSWCFIFLLLSLTSTPNQIVKAKFLIGQFYSRNGSEFDSTVTEIKRMETWIDNSNNFKFSVAHFFSEMCPALSTSLDWYTTVIIHDHLLNYWRDGKIPLFTWQPACYDNDLPVLSTIPAAGSKTKSPDIFIKQFSTGQLDFYLTKVAFEIKTYLSGPDGKYGTIDDRRLYIRLGHEMNGNFYQWNVMANSKISSTDYILFWRYIRKFFDVYLGNNTNYMQRRIQWVWCPNNFDSANLTSKFVPAEDLYPGHDVVVSKFSFVIVTVIVIIFIYTMCRIGCAWMYTTLPTSMVVKIRSLVT